MKDYKFPPDEPTDKSKWFTRAIVFAAIVFCSYQFGFKPLLDEQRSHWDVQDLSDDQKTSDQMSDKMLLPGFHIIDFLPFITVIPEGQVGFLRKSYNGPMTVEKYPVTEIPVGYVGVITNKRTQAVNPKVLTPGKYHIDGELYQVDKIFTEKQTWHFKNSE
jgi:hypothetical protein